MREPAWKHPTVDAVLTSVTGSDRQATIRSGTCVTCECKEVQFRDALSEREYTISGMCQECQDKVWGELEEQEDRGLNI
ncbi:hypothetical protein LCGC14_0713580 [marine sediment metagenome]|uniref:Uncharacterized protein n=1 Tax=marine sediment metagenome TaxID=412755 RepID=A0A0F9QZU2_9ZZZZ